MYFQSLNPSEKYMLYILKKNHQLVCSVFLFSVLLSIIAESSILISPAND